MDLKQGIVLLLIVVGIPLLILGVFEIGAWVVGLICDVLWWDPLFCR